MSYTEIVGFNKNGEAYNLARVENSWRGAPLIWRAIELKYLPPYRPSYVPKNIPDSKIEEWCRFKPTRCSSLDHEDIREVWRLATNDKLSLTDRIVLYTTFDRCLVKKEDLNKVIDAFLNFEAEGTSLVEQADILSEAFNDEDCIAIGWNQTSVTSNQWTNCYDEEKDENFKYNCLAQDEHYWLFDELK